MSRIWQLHEVGRIPMPGDNVAIATRRLEAGTIIAHEGRRLTLDCTALEGHRFAIEPIPVGTALLSWGLPFGVAIKDIGPGAYVCNAGMLEALRGRGIYFEPGAEPNFEDRIELYDLDVETFQPAAQVPRHDHSRTFMGYHRSPSRGVGTRNTIVLLGTTSRTASYVRQLEARLLAVANNYTNIDSIVAVAHSEGGSGPLNNQDLLLRTLAGFIAHPNVGAVLVVDTDVPHPADIPHPSGLVPLSNGMLRNYMIEGGYPLDEILHCFLSLGGGFQAGLEQGEAIVRSWLDRVNDASRTAESVAHLKVALQCGGSDAFSGISGNPLAAWVAKEIISHGGSANLSETAELVGGEAYVLQKVADLETARKFLAMVERLKEWASWHGSTVESNTSGGNKFRGLYNIVLKSIGAAMKRHPDVRLDHVIEYAEPMRHPGYTFMDGPGNDPECVAGQVAAGCNMIFFVTGNGSIINFPFVPTIKIVTTTERYELLSQELDVNAGAYLDGTSMDELGRRMLNLTTDVASGTRSVGEMAGHAQVQILRDWRQTEAGDLDRLLNRRRPSGEPLKTLKVSETFRVFSRTQVGLILPTSLCAGQIARLAAERLNRKGLGREQGLSRFVALVHTEGCGNSSGPSEELFVRTLLGYVNNPLVRHCLLLEHGCEKTHNDYMQSQIVDMGLDPRRLGWASVQLDGGVQRVLQKIEDWFAEAIGEEPEGAKEPKEPEGIHLGLLTAGHVSAAVAESLGGLTRTIVGAGGTVVVPENGSLLASSVFLEQTLGYPHPQPSLAYGQRVLTTGFHIMETPTQHWVETLTGLGATGVEIILAYIGEQPMQGHPLVPVLQVTVEESVWERYGEDIDLMLEGDPNEWGDEVRQLIVAAISGEYTPKLHQQGNTNFQVTRGLLGITL